MSPSLEEVVDEAIERGVRKGVKEALGNPERNSVTCLSIGVLIWLSALVGFNHNVRYETKKEINLKKFDVPFSFTSLTIDKEKGTVDMLRYPIFGEGKFYSNYNGDGKVDYLIIKASIFKNGSYNLSLSREKYFEEYKNFFETADKEFLEELKRFNIENK